MIDLKKNKHSSLSLLHPTSVRVACLRLAWHVVVHPLPPTTLKLKLRMTTSRIKILSIIRFRRSTLNRNIFIIMTLRLIVKMRHSEYAVS